MIKRSRRRWFYAFLCLPALLAVVGFGELLMRGYVWARGWTPNCYAASLDLYQPHPQRGSDLKPNFFLKSGVYRISTNSLGLRGPQLTMEKPAGVTRIAILGGSSAFGYLVNDGQEAARLLEANLNRKGYSSEVINAAVPGYNLYQTISRFQQLVCPLQPDFVVLYLGWNDLRYICSDEPQRFRSRGVASAGQRMLGRSTLYGFVSHRLFSAPGNPAPDRVQNALPTDVGKQQFRENLDQLASAINACGARMVICAQCMAAHPKAEETVRGFVSPDPQVVEQMIQLGAWLHHELQTFAATHQAEFVDAYTELAPSNNILADYIHLTVEGEKHLAKLWTQRFVELLPQSSENVERR